MIPIQPFFSAASSVLDAGFDRGERRKGAAGPPFDALNVGFEQERAGRRRPRSFLLGSLNPTPPPPPRSHAAVAPSSRFATAPLRFAPSGDCAPSAWRIRLHVLCCAARPSKAALRSKGHDGDRPEDTIGARVHVREAPLGAERPLEAARTRGARPALAARAVADRPTLGDHTPILPIFPFYRNNP